MKLGRIPTPRNRLWLAPQHRFGINPAPARVDRSHIAWTPGLFRNDMLPDCTCAAMANCADAVAHLEGFSLGIPDAAPMTLYAGVIGAPPYPASLATTDGAIPLDVLEYQQMHGFNIGDQTPLVGRFGAVPISINTIAHTIARFGAAYIGVTLHDADMSAPDWTDPSTASGVAGGHMIMAWDYIGLGPTDTVRVGTWGRWMPTSWAWIMSRTEEAYALTWRQLAGPAGFAWCGASADELEATLTA